jgi:hypothetical protein
MAVIPKASWPWVRTLLDSVFDQPDAESVGAQYDRVIDALSDKLPKVAEHLDAARADLLALTVFPKTVPTIAQRDGWRVTAHTERGPGACWLRRSSGRQVTDGASANRFH